MRKKTKLVYGVGDNDADYVVNVLVTESSKPNRVLACPFYVTWTSMLERCYSKKRHARFPTYANCSVDPRWHKFSAFRKWMLLQSWEGNQLDKDILIPGNKVYGPDTCVFVSGKLNNFLNDRGAARGEFPIGVTWIKEKGKFRSQCCNPFSVKREHLGYFVDSIEAYEAWRSRKHQIACIYAELQEDQRIAEALRRLYAGSSVNE